MCLIYHDGNGFNFLANDFVNSKKSCSYEICMHHHTQFYTNTLHTIMKSVLERKIHANMLQ